MSTLEICRELTGWRMFTESDAVETAYTWHDCRLYRREYSYATGRCEFAIADGDTMPEAWLESLVFSLPPSCIKWHFVGAY